MSTYELTVAFISGFVTPAVIAFSAYFLTAIVVITVREALLKRRIQREVAAEIRQDGYGSGVYRGVVQG